MTPLRLVTLSGNSEVEAAVAGGLARERDVTVVLRCVDRVETLASIRGGELDAIVAVGLPGWLDKQIAEEAAQAGIKMVAVANDHEHRGFAALGATVLPATAATSQIIARCRSAPVVPPLPSFQVKEHSPGRLIAVWGPKGGPGRSHVATELASELAVRHPDTLLVDADPYGGDLLQLAGVVEELPTIIWASRMAAKDELDVERLCIELRKVDRGGPILLPGLPHPGLWPEVSEFGWRRLLQIVRDNFRFGIFDTGFCLEPGTSGFQERGEGRNGLTRVTLREADRVIAVCKADPVGVKHFIWAASELREVTEWDKVSLVANCVAPREEREVSDLLKRHLGKRPVACLPARTTSSRKIPFEASSSSALNSLVVSVGGELAPRGVMIRLAGGR